MSDPMQPQDDPRSIVGPLRASRRSVVAIAAKLAIATPLALAALPTIAAAKDGDHDDDDDDARRRGRGNGLPPGLVKDRIQQRSGFMLVPVGAVNGGAGGADFTATSAGGDALATGAVFVADNRQAVVVLRGVAASTAFEVFFERFQDHGREDLGAITSDAGGNFNGRAPNVLGGNNRVGTFVVARGGSDEFVSTMA
jgi:hypothetical protein